MLKAVRDITQLTEADKAEAVRIVLDGLGKAEIEIAASYVCPLIWTVLNGDGTRRMKGGTAFFLDTGQAFFGVTAAHVVVDFFADSKMPGVQASLAAHGKPPLIISMGDRIIDGNEEIDIATFRIERTELAYLEKNALCGHVPIWPPKLAQTNGPATYCGFPGIGRKPLRDGISFGMTPMSGLVTSSHETLISIQIEREYLVQVVGNEKMPDVLNLGGMSGGPLITIIQAEVLRTWKPGGVVISGPNPGDNPEQESISDFELIQARPIHFIKADGHLDLERWEHANIR